jgi:hypothetical protein
LRIKTILGQFNDSKWLPKMPTGTPLKLFPKRGVLTGQGGYEEALAMGVIRDHSLWLTGQGGF